MSPIIYDETRIRLLYHHVISQKYTQGADARILGREQIFAACLSLKKLILQKRSKIAHLPLIFQKFALLLLFWSRLLKTTSRSGSPGLAVGGLLCSSWLSGRSHCQRNRFRSQ